MFAAPKLKGRPRKKRKLKEVTGAPNSPEGSEHESNSSEGSNCSGAQKVIIFLKFVLQNLHILNFYFKSAALSPHLSLLIFFIVFYLLTDSKFEIKERSFGNFESKEYEGRNRILKETHKVR